ncbi:MAG: acyl-CoA dehydrogenase family protein [Thermaerobacter sp.]|nr:acyl-CoA dehydrogenase family protein [Thermaerobacter sp.]
MSLSQLGPDYFEVDALLSEDERSIRTMVHDFVEAEVMPTIGENWLKGVFPRDLIAKMAQLGIYGPTLPEKYGGAGISQIAYGMIMQELERGDSGLRSFASVQSGLAMHAIYRYGSEEQRLHWLPRMARGEVIGCFGLTEPDAGSDPGTMRTRARRTSSGWVLNGAKRWITNSPIADIAIVWARDEEERIRGFIVPNGTPGMSTPKIETKISMRASVTGDIILEDVEIGEEMRLPEAKSLGAPLSCLTQARFGIACGAVGAAMDCFNEALAYAKDRIAFQRPIAQTQLMQERLVDMLSLISRSQLVALRLAQLKQEGTYTYAQVSLAKRDNVRAALEVARMGREVLGGNGITVEYKAMRHSANLETVDTYEGTYEIHTLIVGRDITGLNALG